MGPSLTGWAQETQKYTVKPGDTLWDISQRFYGDVKYWPALWEMNRYQTTNPHQISVGDVLTIYPLEVLVSKPAPPPPPPIQKNLYDRGAPLDTKYPRYFTYVADPSGIGHTGINRIKVKKTEPQTGKVIITYDEIREVGEVLSSLERGYQRPEKGLIHGRLLLTYHDDVVVRFTEDVAQILDSATYEDPDPYFREFPIYGTGEEIREPDQRRPEYDEVIGRLHTFKGMLTVIARVETLVPLSQEQKERLARSPGRNLDSQGASYVARITYSQEPINIGDRIFLFKSLYPGPDRQIDTRKHGDAGEYRQ